jgi:hypothetical protein
MTALAEIETFQKYEDIVARGLNASVGPERLQVAKRYHSS